MTTDPNELVQVAAGDLVRIEVYQRALADAGIESRVVGEDLGAGIGSALPASIELWARRTDADRAAAAIRLAEAERGRGAPDHPPHGRPASDPKPHQPPAHGPHPHYNPDPRP
jgi:hypothetical protein